MSKIHTYNNCLLSEFVMSHLSAVMLQIKRATRKNTQLCFEICGKNRLSTQSCLELPPHVHFPLDVCEFVWFLAWNPCAKWCYGRNEALDGSRETSFKLISFYWESPEILFQDFSHTYPYTNLYTNPSKGFH